MPIDDENNPKEYNEPKRMSLQSIKHSLDSKDEKAMTAALLSLAYHHKDWNEAQSIASKYLNYPSEQVSQIAIRCLGLVARFHGMIDVDKALTMLIGLGESTENLDILDEIDGAFFPILDVLQERGYDQHETKKALLSTNAVTRFKALSVLCEQEQDITLCLRQCLVSLSDDSPFVRISAMRGLFGLFGCDERIVEFFERQAEIETHPLSKMVAQDSAMGLSAIYDE